ncbi:hypothetical protein [Acidithiobacillus sp. AMEEHan]|uniref:hypothetical protein n=1 Tax=Acidithiobacillus sp. AMEEHan TaxID=2994951 RepID=UPI0027E5914D|nr:hypothetical protein [Acidithiobacillus sp. AMEEHan]
MAEQRDSALPPLTPHARVVEGQTRRGKPCRIVDNTGTVAEAELRTLLEELIEQDHFQPLGLSMAGGNSIQIGAPQTAHVQLGDDLYRLIVLDYEARIEGF